MKLHYLLIYFVIVGCTTSKNKISEEDKTLNPTLPFTPNILWIVAEDLSPYLPFYGDSTISVPNLERLADEGIVYDNFLTPHPVCSPARASIITGMYANHIGASHMRTGPWYSDNVSQKAIETYAGRLPEGVVPYEAIPPVGVKMFPEFLRRNGYFTSNNRKEDYQFRKLLTTWDESGGKAHWRNREKGQKFFSVFNFEVTHESRIWTKAKDSLWVSQDLEVTVPPYLPNTEIALNDIRRMYSNIKEMDTQVGDIINQLEEDGLLDSTIIFWYGDHGGPLPRQKRLLYESGVKVPLVVRFPNAMEAGKRDNRITSFIDLAPTVLSLMRIQPPDYMEGKAFLGDFIRDVEPKYAYGAADRFDEKPDRIRSVRDKKFKYIKYYMPEKPMYLDVLYRRQMPIMQELLRLRDEGKLNQIQALWFRETKPNEELFDIENDPHEVNNLADDPKYKGKLEELRKACEEWVNSGKDTGIIPEPDLLAKLWPEGSQLKVDTPTIEENNGKWKISCTTPGVTIGYRIYIGDSLLSNSWQIYNNPLTLDKGYSIEVIADRIGYLASDIVRD